MIPPPAQIGMDASDVDTPALLVDLDRLDSNIRRMQARVAGTGAVLRPHAKTHKSTAIASLQVAAGAVGVCCQKVSEAEILADGGVADLCVSNEVVGPAKLRRLAALARRVRVSACVDDAGALDAMAQAAQQAGSQVSVLVELDVGAGRCGVASPQAAVALARQAAASRGLRFAGLQAYQGSAQHLRGHAEREAAIGRAARLVEQTLSLLRAEGLACPVVAGAGTGSFEFELASGLWTELQAGSYVFMDADYGRNADAHGRPVSEFDQALFVQATVMSVPTAGRCVVDAGLKTFSVDSGLPVVYAHPGLDYVRASDEHGQLDASDPSALPRLGDTLHLVPGHCDPTVNLHDWYVGVRGGVRSGKVECLWPVSARGAVF